ncbi:EthD family reductase [Chitinophaga alhagiae]|uniref:EthD family reductase n=1 Tax=Chitinophaga alhagiae TaxID=2203219 RepID=UPI000E5AF17B|nr:EthD family reductase [Chitinophaga alhagiae]
MEQKTYCATVIYPYHETVSFDVEAYKSDLAPAYARLLGPNCVQYEVRKGWIAPGASHPPFTCIASFWVLSPEEFSKAMAAPEMGALMARITAFTTITPIRQFDEVVGSASLA